MLLNFRKKIRENHTLAVAIVSFIIATFFKMKPLNLDPHDCNYYLEQPIRIISGSIHWYCQQVIAVNVIFVLILITGIIFLFYWLLIGRIKNLQFFSLTTKNEKAQTKWKMIVLAVILGAGLTPMYLGINTLLLEPPVQHTHNYIGKIRLPDGEVGRLDLKFNSLNGIMPSRGIHVDMFVTLPEKISNATTIEIELPKAGIMLDNNGGIPTVGEIISLNYSQSDSMSSVYIFKDLSLMYDYPGQYDAILTINKTKQLTSTFESIISVRDWNEYIAQKENYQTQSLGWIVFGISIITIATIFTEFVDLRYKHLELKEKEDEQ